jgi:hypothetical protein
MEVTVEGVAMTKAEAPTTDRHSRTMPAATPGKRRVPPFWWHFLQMLAAMVVGMIATSAVFLTIVGLKTWDEVIIQYPTQSLMTMAAGMTVPMVSWMLYGYPALAAALLRHALSFRTRPATPPSDAGFCSRMTSAP